MVTVEAPQISAPPAAGLRDRAVDASGLAFLQVDRAGVIRDWNPAAERLFGWTREEILGQRLTDTVIPPALRSAHNAGFARRLVSGDSDGLGHPTDVPALHRDGSELRISMTVDALGDDGFFAFVTDRTGGHRAQQLDHTRERHTELDLKTVRGDLTDLVGRLAVRAATVPATAEPDPTLAALIAAPDQEALAGLWQAVLRGERADAALAGHDGRLLVRLRLRGPEVNVSCFRISTPPDGAV